MFSLKYSMSNLLIINLCLYLLLATNACLTTAEMYSLHFLSYISQVLNTEVQQIDDLGLTQKFKSIF